MYKKEAVLFVSVLLLAVLIFFGLFKMTGFAINNRDLIVSLDIPPDQQKISPGQSLLLEVAVRKPGGSIDQTSTVDLEYSIKDAKGNIISSKNESGALAVKESEVTSLIIPTGTKPGVYTASVAVGYGENTYVASKTFEVIGSRSNLNFPVYFLIILILIFIYLIVNRYFIIKKRKRRK